MNAFSMMPDCSFEELLPTLILRAVTSTDFRNRLTVSPNSNRIRLTERFASPYGALCFHARVHGQRFPTGTPPPIIASSLVVGSKSN